jgi:hypothetical protein
VEIAKYQELIQWAEELDGVFTLPDLKVALNQSSEVTLYRRLRELTSSGALIKIKRGIYSTPTASLSTISSRIEPQSYISTGTILSSRAIIGSIPARRVQAVKVGRPRTFTCELGTIEYLSIQPKLFMGYTEDAGIKRATAEKAFLDACYFHYKGKRFSFDIETDINREALDMALIDAYLKNYDQRFITFYNRIWKTDV